MASATFLGFITASPDPPGIDVARWIDLVAEHPQLLAFPDHREEPFHAKGDGLSSSPAAKLGGVCRAG
jgi:hypothetical protein